MEVKRIKQPIKEYIAILTFLVSTMRRRKRQIEIFVNMSVIKVCIQSAQPRTWKYRRCEAVR